MRHLAPFSIALLVACGPKDPASIRRELDIQDAPAWRTEEGRKEVWRDVARWSIENGLADEALSMVARLREAGEDSPELEVIQGRALAAQGVAEEARLALEAAVKRVPRDAEAKQALGVVYADLGETELAIATLREALKLQPDHVPTRNNLGFLLLSQGRCAEAVTELQACVGADGSQARYRNNLGFALVCTGDAQRALQLFRTTGPEAQARYHMGVAYERLDSRPAAQLQYEQAVAADPQYKPAVEALARFDGGNPTTLPGEAP